MSEISAEQKLYIKEQIERAYNKAEERIEKGREEAREKADNARNQAIGVLGVIVLVIGIAGFFKIDKFIQDAVEKRITTDTILKIEEESKTVLEGVKQIKKEVDEIKRKSSDLYANILGYEQMTKSVAENLSPQVWSKYNMKWTWKTTEERKWVSVDEVILHVENDSILVLTANGHAKYAGKNEKGWIYASFFMDGKNLAPNRDLGGSGIVPLGAYHNYPSERWDSLSLTQIKAVKKGKHKVELRVISNIKEKDAFYLNGLGIQIIAISATLKDSSNY